MDTAPAARQRCGILRAHGHRSDMARVGAPPGVRVRLRPGTEPRCRSRDCREAPGACGRMEGRTRRRPEGLPVEGIPGAREAWRLHAVGHPGVSVVADSGLLHASRGTQVVMDAQWLRHAATLPAVVVGTWYGVEQGSRGAFIFAGAGALAWLAWPEASRFLAWRRRRRTEGARIRLERAVTRADRDVAKAERAKERADRRPSSAGVPVGRSASKSGPCVRSQRWRGRGTVLTRSPRHHPQLSQLLPLEAIQADGG